jgi:polyisoprenoid-binding protein YceI
MKTLVAAAACAAACLAVVPAHAATYTIDPTHTFVNFEANHYGTSTVRGRFDRKDGSVQFDRAARTGRVDITIDTASINTGVAPFNSHLKSKDFFDVTAHPKARFVGERLVFNGDKLSEVAGNLTLLGKTLPVTLKATQFNCYDNPLFKREVCGGDFETTIARSQWGMNWGLEMGIPDSVRLLIQVEAIKQ